MADEALVPLSVAVSVTAVPVGTLMLVPLWPPPDSEVVTEVGWGDGLTVSISPASPHVLCDPALVVSPEYTACQ